MSSSFNLVATQQVTIPAKNRLLRKKLTWTHHHFSAFFMTYFSYALYHAIRKTFSNVKHTMDEEWSPTNTSETIQFAYDYQQWNSRSMFNSRGSSMIFMGILDLTFMLTYSAGLFICGMLGDRYNMRYFLSTGMMLSAITIFAFGCLSKWLGFYSVWYYGVVIALCGIAQSSGWPCVVAIITNWFGKGSRGLMFGLWGSTASFGNIIGSYTAGGILKYGYEFAFLVTSTMIFAAGVVVFFGLVTSPSEIGLTNAHDDRSVETENEKTVPEGYVDGDIYKIEWQEKFGMTGRFSSLDDRNSDELPMKVLRFNSSQVDLLDERPRDVEPEVDESKNSGAVSFLQALLLPGVIPYSLSYSFLKPVNYAFFFWLPYYLTSAYGWDQAVCDDLSTWYDVGGIIGGFVFGVISDKLKFRSPVVTLMLVISPAAIYFYTMSPDNQIINTVLMSIVGLFLNGTTIIMSTSVTADLGRQKAIKNNQEALATVTGIIDGSASFTSAIGQVLVPIINTTYGWHVVFYLFMILTFTSAVCLIPPLKRDWEEWKTYRRERKAGAV